MTNCVLSDWCTSSLYSGSEVIKKGKGPMVSSFDTSRGPRRGVRPWRRGAPHGDGAGAEGGRGGNWAQEHPGRGMKRDRVFFPARIINGGCK